MIFVYWFSVNCERELVGQLADETGLPSPQQTNDLHPGGVPEGLGERCQSDVARLRFELGLCRSCRHAACAFSSAWLGIRARTMAENAWS